MRLTDSDRTEKEVGPGGLTGWVPTAADLARCAGDIGAPGNLVGSVSVDAVARSAAVSQTRRPMFAARSWAETRRIAAILRKETIGALCCSPQQSSRSVGRTRRGHSG